MNTKKQMLFSSIVMSALFLGATSALAAVKYTGCRLSGVEANYRQKAFVYVDNCEQKLPNGEVFFEISLRDGSVPNDEAMVDLAQHALTSNRLVDVTGDVKPGGGFLHSIKMK